MERLLRGRCALILGIIEGKKRNGIMGEAEIFVRFCSQALRDEGRESKDGPGFHSPGSPAVPDEIP